MKPLSPLLYTKRNKRKIFASINAVTLAVAFLYILYGFTSSILSMEERAHVLFYKKAASISSFEQKPIDKSLIEDISKNKNVDRIVASNFNYGIRFEIPGASDSAVAVPLRSADVDYFMKAQGIKLIQGNLPKEESQEVAVNKDIAKNRKLKIGDKIGDSINKFDSIPGEYLVVGILDSEALTSILSANDSILPDYKNEEIVLSRSFYVFPKAGKKASMDAYISKVDKTRVVVATEETSNKAFERKLGALKVLDVISILSIIVMVVTVGSTKYAQYINRKEELGLLNALGYNKRNILFRTFKEVVITNAIGFILGIGLGVIMQLFNSKRLWEPLGVRGFLFTTKGFVVAILVPLFTILFSIIPINNLINKLDPIKMIEKN
ncbi:MAG TPA: ABC transporter permease [Clostridiaceae bacterium]